VAVDVHANAPTPADVRAVRAAAVTVPAVAIVVGGVAAAYEPRLALLAAAVIFGWSQLAGA
jgi:hypothetical protein